jgi:hypothetical protein
MQVLYVGVWRGAVGRGAGWGVRVAGWRIRLSDVGLCAFVEGFILKYDYFQM